MARFQRDFASKLTKRDHLNKEATQPTAKVVAGAWLVPQELIAQSSLVGEVDRRNGISATMLVKMKSTTGIPLTAAERKRLQRSRQSDKQKMHSKMKDRQRKAAKGQNGAQAKKNTIGDLERAIELAGCKQDDHTTLAYSQLSTESDA